MSLQSLGHTVGREKEVGAVGLLGVILDEVVLRVRWSYSG